MASSLKIHIIILVFISLFASSCLTKKEFSEVVKKNVEIGIYTNTKVNTPYLILKTDKLPAADSAVEIKKLSSYMVPLFFFWGWDRSYQCDINNRYFSNLFAGALEDKAKEFELEKILGDKKIEITLEQVPKGFLYTNTGSVYFLMVAYFYDFDEKIYPQSQNFKISYKLMQGERELKSDTLSYQFQDPVKNTADMSISFVDFYMQDLKTNFENKSNEFIERIIEEL